VDRDAVFDWERESGYSRRATLFVLNLLDLSSIVTIDFCSSTTVEKCRFFGKLLMEFCLNISREDCRFKTKTFDAKKRRNVVQQLSFLLKQ